MAMPESGITRPVGPTVTVSLPAPIVRISPVTVPDTVASRSPSPSVWISPSTVPDTVASRLPSPRARISPSTVPATVASRSRSLTTRILPVTCPPRATVTLKSPVVAASCPGSPLAMALPESEITRPVGPTVTAAKPRAKTMTASPCLLPTVCAVPSTITRSTTPLGGTHSSHAERPIAMALTKGSRRSPALPTLPSLLASICRKERILPGWTLPPPLCPRVAWGIAPGPPSNSERTVAPSATRTVQTEGPSETALTAVPARVTIWPDVTSMRLPSIRDVAGSSRCLFSLLVDLAAMPLACTVSMVPEDSMRVSPVPTFQLRIPRPLSALSVRVLGTRFLIVPAALTMRRPAGKPLW